MQRASLSRFSIQIQKNRQRTDTLSRNSASSSELGGPLPAA
jgi:hypothetical protein